jgi:trigger factor
MQSEIREISPVLVEVTVEVPWDRIHKDLNDTYREIGKTARVRGFRPGKVPKNVLKQVYGRQAAAQVTGTLVEQGLMHAVQEHELHIVAQPEMEEPPELEQGKPLTFKAKVEVRPKIDEVAVDGLEVWQKPIDIPDEDVDAEIEQLRHQHGEIQIPDPMRPAQEGDLITIDYTVAVDGEAKEDLGAEGRQVEIDDEHLLPALKEGLVGMKPDDEKTLDDEFAKDCGDYATLLELRLKIREGLEGSLIQANDIPVPPSMVQQQQQMMMYEMAQFMQMAGQQGAPGADFFSGIEERAQRRVQAGILLGSLARQEGIDVSEADLDAKFQEIADQTGKHVAKVRADYQEAQRDALESQLLEEKVMALLTERAKIHEGERPEPEAKDDEPAKEEGEE